MTKREIIRQLPKLSSTARREIRATLDELEALVDDDADDGEVSDEQMEMIEQRIAEYERNPTPSAPWSETYALLKARFALEL